MIEGSMDRKHDLREQCLPVKGRGELEGLEERHSQPVDLVVSVEFSYNRQL